MILLSKSDFLANKKFYLSEMGCEKIFIYPTDTIYGIGCDATNSAAVAKIREAKRREEKPFSVIAPSKQWITENCVVKNKKWLDKLPGQYTLILKMKSLAVAKEVNSKSDTLGVRIPDNWFSEIVAEFGKPFVTTSVNLSGEKSLQDIEDLHDRVKEYADYFVYDGKKEGQPSTIVNLVREKEEIIER